MEAAGIIALVRAITSTALQARTLCTLWKDAPRNVFFLRDELDTCQAFFEVIQAGILESSFMNQLAGEPTASANLQCQRETLGMLLSRGTGVTRNLEELLIEIIGQPANTTSKGLDVDENPECPARLALKKKILWLRRMDHVTTLRKMLRRTTDEIGLCLAILNVQFTTITAQAAPIREVIQQSEAKVLARLRETGESCRKEIESAAQRFEGGIETRLENLINRRLDESFLALSSRLEDRMISVIRQQQLLESLPHLEPVGTHLASHSRHGYNRLTRRTPTSTGRLIYHRSTNYVQAVLPTSEPRCPCRCHVAVATPTRRWEFPWLRHLLGSARITSYGSNMVSGANGLPAWCQCQSQGCNDLKRDQDSRGWVLIQYNFPPWLARAIVSVYFLRQHRPEFLIRIHRIIDQGDPSSWRQSIMGRIEMNDIAGVRAILTAHPSSVLDVAAGRELSALYWAVELKNVPMIDLLLQAGADPFQPDVKGQSAATGALGYWMVCNSQPDPDSVAYKIAALMSLSTLFDNDEYTAVHRVCMGLLQLDLETALTSPFYLSQVNSKNISGADPNLESKAGSPLHWACAAGNEEGFHALIEAGALPWFGYPWKTLLHAAASFIDRSETFIDTLVKPEYGADLEEVDFSGSTALGIAAATDNSGVLKRLIRAGANMEQVNLAGDSPLLSAIWSISMTAVKILLGKDKEAGVIQGVEERYRAVNTRNGLGVLHYLAQKADKEMMETFTQLKMTGLPDPDTYTGNGGKTAGDIFRERVGSHVVPGYFGPVTASGADNVEDKEKGELVKAWERLLASINIESGTAVEDTSMGNFDGMSYSKEEDDSVPSDDDFFDAQED